MPDPMTPRPSRAADPRAQALAELEARLREMIGELVEAKLCEGEGGDELAALGIEDDIDESINKLVDLARSALAAPVEPAGTPEPSRAEVEAALNRVADVVVTTWPKDEHVTLVETMDREALRTLRRALAARAAQGGGA